MGDKESGEEGDGDGEGEEGGEGRRPIVPEIPVDVQGYRIIDSRGPDGINNAVSSVNISPLVNVTSNTC